MADAWDAFPDAPAPAAGGKADAWADFPDAPSAAPAASAAASHDEKVQAAIPQARQDVANQNSAESVADIIHPSIPILDSAAGKAFDWAMAKLGYGKGDNAQDRAGSLQAADQAHRMAVNEAHPYATWIGTTGGLLGSAIGAPAATGLVRGLGVGAASGAAQGVADQPAESNWSDTGKSAGEGAALGAGTAGLLHGVGTLPGIWQAAKNYLSPESAATQTVLKAARRVDKPGMTLQDYTTNPDATLADVRGMKDPLQKAAGRVPESTSLENLNEKLGERSQDTLSRVSQHVDDAFGQPLNAFDFRDQGKQVYKNTSKWAYDTALFGTKEARAPIWNKDLENFINTKNGIAAARAAADNLSAMSFVPGTTGYSRPFPLPFTKVGDAWQFDPTKGTPNLEFWDAVKQELGSMYSQSGSGAEKEAMKNQTQWLTNFLRDPKHPWGNDYGTALDTASKYFGESNAFDAGIKYAQMGNAATKTKPGDVQKMQSAFQNQFTPEEKDLFAQGLGSYFKDNPTDAMKIFSKGDSKTMDAYRQVLGGQNSSLGDVRLNQLQSNLSVENMMNKLNQIKSVGHPVEDAALPSIAALGVLEHGWHALPTILTGQILKKFAYDAPMARRAEALLDLASRSQDPQVKQQLAQALASDQKNRQVFSKMQGTIDSYLSAQAGSAPQTPSPLGVQPVFRAEGGEVGDATQESEKIDHGAIAEKLIKLAKETKKDQSKMTEPLLGVDDNTVAKALEVSNRHI